MLVFSDKNDPKIVELLRRGAVGIIRTDTLYGVVGRADQQQTVERIYTIKERSEHKSPIVLVASYDQLFDTPVSEAMSLLNDTWPGKVSVILPAQAAPHWLTRGNDSVAYRMPAPLDLRRLLEATGPLIAPSANLEGEPPAMSIAQAQRYFGNTVDFYVDEGEVENETPSQLIRLKADGTVERLR